MNFFGFFGIYFFLSEVVSVTTLVKHHSKRFIYLFATPLQKPILI